MNSRITAENAPNPRPARNRPCRSRVPSRVLVGLAGVLIGTSLGAAASAQTGPTGRQWAILVGIEKYRKARPLPFTTNDVRQLSETLRIRGGYSPDCLLEITDEATDPARQPSKTAVMQKLSEWLKKPAAEDQILVYFSGHGFRDADGKMYLASIDCDPADAARTGIPVAWLRQQVADCPANAKLVLLDTCHAGADKGEGAANDVAAETIGAAFKGLERVTTLASSTADQSSQLWDDKRQSLFTYWLNQGLRGNADKDGDGNVDVHELYEYTYRAVTRVAKNVLHRAQTPVRIMSGVEGVQVVVRLKPLSLRQLLDDMAEQISDDMLERRVARIGVLEFGNDAKLGELVLGANFGVLGRYCAEELEQRLVGSGAGKFTVVARQQLQAALKAQKFGLKELASPEALTRLSQATQDGMPVVALGTLRNRTGRVVTLQCKLLRTEDEGLAGATGGTARLNESEWAMLGASAALQPEDHLPEPPAGGGPPPPLAEQVVQKLDQRAQGPHPLDPRQDPKCPYRVQLVIRGRERTPVFRGNQMLVPVRQGEVYEIWVQNVSGKEVVMRLLVDGLNTLCERERTKGVSTWLVAPRVNLDSARPWFLAAGQQYAVRGFVTQTGAKGKLNEFKVVDAARSVAARQQFTDQVGIITAAFYDALPGGDDTRGVGTDLGQERDEKIEEQAGVRVGNLLTVINIRYVDAEALQAEKKH
jgi:hypothetical protein